VRIFAAGLGTETNSFSPLPTGLRGFEEYLRLPAGTHLSEPQEATGAPWAVQQYAARNGATAVLGPISFAMPAGPTVRHVYESLRDEVLAALKAALPLDVVAYSLHGAMIAEGYDDCEGDLLARTRALVGPEVAVGAARPALPSVRGHDRERRRDRDVQGISAYRFRRAWRRTGQPAGAHGAARDPTAHGRP
jgi:microcystin degradation protein MlrC